MSERLGQEGVGHNGRISYAETIQGVVGHEMLTPNERVGIKAVDLMVGALKVDPVFEESILETHNITIGNKRRLTDRSDPNYRKDLLWGVHDPDELFVGVLINSTQMLDDEKHVQDWGRRMMKVATEMDASDDSDTVSAKRSIGDLVIKESKYFSMEFSPKREAVLVGSSSG